MKKKKQLIIGKKRKNEKTRKKCYKKQMQKPEMNHWSFSEKLLPQGNMKSE